MEFIKETESILDEVLCTEYTESDEVRKLALERFYKNVKLANKIAFSFSVPIDNSIDREDILQEAYIGLWQACVRFDDSRGLQFSTYAVPLIKGNVLRLLRDTSAVKYPRSFKNIRSALNSHGFTLPLTEEEIDVLIQEKVASRAVIARYLMEDMDMVSLDAPITSDADTSIGELIPDNKYSIELDFSEDELEEAINCILQYIKPAHRDIVEEWLYVALAGQSISQYVLAKKYNLSQPHIARILKSAIDIACMNKEEILTIFGR